MMMATNLSVDPANFVWNSGNPSTDTLSAVPNDRVVLEVLDGMGGIEMAVQADESTFPLNWATASRMPDEHGFEVRSLRFQYSLRPLYLVAHIGKNAATSDRDALTRIVASIAPA